MPLTQQQVWSIRMRLEAADKVRNLALLNWAIDSKLRACDLLRLKVSDVSSGDSIVSRALVVQQKSGRPVRFELTLRTRDSVQALIEHAGLCMSDILFPSRIRRSLHLSTRQYARIVNSWVSGIGLDQVSY